MIRDLAEHALSLAKTDGCVVVAQDHSEANLRWAGNSLTTNGQMHSQTLTVISVVDRPDGAAAGVVTRSVTTPDEVAELVAASESVAREADPADDAAPLIEGSADGWGHESAETNADVFAGFAADLGAAFGSWRSADRLLFGFAEHQVTTTYVASSTGLRRRYVQPNGRVEINGKSADFKRSAWAGVHTTDFTDVDVSALADTLEQRLDWAAKSLDLPAGRYETLLPPGAVADLMLDLYWTASARDAEEGRNVFAGPNGTTRIGETLSPLPLTLRSNPDEPGLECAPFEVATSSGGGMQSVFDNGAPVQPTDWIRDGKLVNLVRDRAWATRTGTEPRFMQSNLVMDAGGTASLEQMIASTERGLLLTCLWYIREVDPQTLLLTGLTRDGVYLVENGAVQGAVNNFRWNESPVDLLRRISEVGRTERTLCREWNDYFTRTAMPPVRVPDFNMSTVSPAS